MLKLSPFRGYLRCASCRIQHFGSSMPHPLPVAFDVISESEEATLVEFLDGLLYRKKYEGYVARIVWRSVHSGSLHMLLVFFSSSGNHWDDVIVHYKETEICDYRTSAFPEVKRILSSVEDRIRIMEVTTKNSKFLSPHAIDLSATGYIGG